MHFIYVIYDTCAITSAVEQGHLCQSEHGKAKIPVFNKGSSPLGSNKAEQQLQQKWHETSQVWGENSQSTYQWNDR